MKKLFVTGFIVVILAMLCLIYYMELSKKVNSKIFINHIVKMKVDSCITYYSIKKSCYFYYIENKYKIERQFTKGKKFEGKDKNEILIKDIDGDVVYTDLFDFNYWQSDDEKLIRFLDSVHKK